MKLHFSKSENGDISVRMEKATSLINFDYIEMLRQLIANNEIEEPEWGNLDANEKTILQGLLQQIKEAVQEGLEKDVA